MTNKTNTTLWMLLACVSTIAIVSPWITLINIGTAVVFAAAVLLMTETHTKRC